MCWIWMWSVDLDFLDIFIIKNECKDSLEDSQIIFKELEVEIKQNLAQISRWAKNDMKIDMASAMLKFQFQIGILF